MHQVVLKSDGVLHHNNRAITGHALPFLGFFAALPADCTLRAVFRMMERYPALGDLNPFLPSLLDEYRNSPAMGCVTADYERLALIRTVEMIGFPGEPRLEIYPCINGIAQEAMTALRQRELKLLLDMPFGIGKLRHIIFGDPVDRFDFAAVFNLFEVIDAVSWELSFNGPHTTCALRR